MQCCICLQAPTSPVCQPCCSNVFCHQCLQNWKQVKNTCPLCAAKMGTQQINTLKAPEESNHFDDGFMIIQTQIQQMKHRIQHVQSRIHGCREQSHKIKSLFSASHIVFVDDQFQLIKQYEHQIDKAWQKQDRVVCVQFLQLMVELIGSVECALNGSIKESYIEIEDEQRQMSQYDDEQEEDEYSMYEQFEERKQFHKQKKISKLNSNMNKNKSAKEI